MLVHIRLLGEFGVTVDGREIPRRAWRRRSAADLVKLLSLAPARRLLRDQVVDALWPDLDLEDAAPRLHTAAHYARGATGVREGVVLVDGAVALFPTASVTVDVEHFLRTADALRRDATPTAAGAAADLCTGLLLPDDLYAPWTEEPRERVRRRQVDLLRQAGRYEELVELDPLDEEAQLEVVREHVRCGRRQHALRSLDAMTELFSRELGVEPGAAARELRRAAESLPTQGTIPLQRPAPTSPPTGKSEAPAVRGRAPLPAPRTRLVGRRHDLDGVAALLEQHRVVTITGPGGAGKSTLALALARRFAGQEGAPAGTEVILAELAPVRDAAGVTRAVAEAAGIQGEGATRTAALGANLGSRSVLLVLDNCEHLLDASAELVDAMLDAGVHARVLVTSREPLGVDGEAVHRLGSLGTESAELFVERAVAAAGPGTATAEDPRVVDLCARLDGLPLAIELAAAQLRHLGLQDLIDRLDDRLTLLVGGRPKAGSRHSALYATIEWSHRLLSEEARKVFDRLGVFPATFGLAAVEAVSGLAPARAATVLGDLVAKSLVVHEPATRRYRLLETIRLFAVRRLEEAGTRDEVTEILRRHVVARSAAAPRVRAWLSASLAARSRDDLENVRLAFETSLACGDLSSAVDVALGVSTMWRNAVSYAEGRRWVETLREQDLAPRDQLWALLLSADIGLGSGDTWLMREAALAAEELSARVDDRGAALITEIYGALARLVDPAVAAERLHRAAARAREEGEPGLERLARGFCLVPMRMLGLTDGLDDEAAVLTAPGPGRDYDRYICLWSASLLALVDRDGPRLRQLMDAQLTDLMASGLHENWLTMYWQSLSLIATGRPYLAQLRRARARAEAEGRQAEADCVLALGYAAACHDEWVRAAELLGATSRALRRDTAGFIQLTLLREQLVRPHLGAAALAQATARGETLSLASIVEEEGL